ncbi:MAG: hypothetical protein AAGF12_40365 [Myxococcota bacterium]
MSDSENRRVLYALLRASARLAKTLEIPAKQVQEWVRLAYFDELRRDGNTVAIAAEKLGVSEPTGARLARALRTDFLTDEAEYELPKRIAFMLWAGPMSRARLRQVLTEVDEDELDQALDRLLAEGRIVEQSGRVVNYAITDPEDRLVQPGFAARIGALNSLLGNVVGVIDARFFSRREDAFARTVSFRMRRADRKKLRAFYTKTVWPFLRDLEAKVSEGDTTQVTRFSILWAQDEDSEKE